MALTLLSDFAFKHVDQTDTVSGSPTTFKANMDSQAKAIRDFLNGTHKTEIDGHIAATTAHGAVSAATPSTIIVRDAAGRAKVVAPSAEDDIALKSNVTTVAGDLTTHTSNTTTAHGAVSTATASKIIIRDASGRAKVVAPSAADDIALLSTVTGNVEDTPTVGHTTNAASGNSVALHLANYTDYQIGQIYGVRW